jgi:hypothetical protein
MAIDANLSILISLDPLKSQKTNLNWNSFWAIVRCFMTIQNVWSKGLLHHRIHISMSSTWSTKIL